jgi:hypothetical protein
MPTGAKKEKKSETLSQKHPTQKGTGGVAQMVKELA